LTSQEESPPRACPAPQSPTDVWSSNQTTLPSPVGAGWVPHRSASSATSFRPIPDSRGSGKGRSGAGRGCGSWS